MKAEFFAIVFVISLLFHPQIWLDVFAIHGFNAFSDSRGIVRTLGNFTVTITNVGQVGQLENAIGSFRIQIHSSFINLGNPRIDLATTKSWACNISDSTLSCNASAARDKLKGGERLSITISAMPISEGVFEWITTTFHFKSFQNPIALMGSQPTISVEANNEPDDRPNIIVITTDEQRWNTVEFTPNVQKLIIGTEFIRSTVAMERGACKRELKRIEWKIIRRIMMTIHNEGNIKKTVIAMKSGLSYDRCVLYLEWMKTMDLIRKEIDRDGFELISLSDRGNSLYELKFKDTGIDFTRER